MRLGIADAQQSDQADGGGVPPGLENYATFLKPRSYGGRVGGGEEGRRGGGNCTRDVAELLVAKDRSQLSTAGSPPKKSPPEPVRDPSRPEARGRAPGEGRGSAPRRRALPGRAAKPSRGVRRPRPARTRRRAWVAPARASAQGWSRGPAGRSRADAVPGSRGASALTSPGPAPGVRAPRQGGGGEADRARPPRLPTVP